MNRFQQGKRERRSKWHWLGGRNVQEASRGGRPGTPGPLDRTQHKLALLTGIVVRQRNGTRFVIPFELLNRSVTAEIDASDFDPHAAANV